MMKTKIALAILLTSFVLAPAGARTSKAAKPKQTSSAKAKTSSKASARADSKSNKSKGKGKAAAVAAPVAAAAAPIAAPVSQNRNDRYMDSQAMQFLTALWRVDPEGGIYVGKFDAAAKLT